MQHAIALARKQLGQTWPNPAVGAVVVADNQIIAEAATAKGGRPHAETAALAQAGEKAKGATLYVTLEPCNHHGKTPPCTNAIIAAGIAHVVIACRDPHSEAKGGSDRLRSAGIAVTEGICEQEACEINRGFFSVVEKKRPYIALKLATSADGKIANKPGVRTDITSAQSRTHVQMLRCEFDAILTGIGTVLADDPLLTVRVPGFEHCAPVRVVMDRHKRLPESSQLVKTSASIPVWTFDQSLEKTIDLITEKGITRLLVEAGQGINTSFMESGLVDRIYWYKAPHHIGELGLSALKDQDLSAVLKDWQQVGDVITIGSDTLTLFEKKS